MLRLHSKTHPVFGQEKLGDKSMTKEEDEHDIDVYRKFLIRCVQGKEKFVSFTGKNGHFKTISMSDKQNKKHRELLLISFINETFGERND